MPDYDADVAAVGRAPAVPTILDVVCQTTGMGFAAVARVTDTHWIACSVRDSIDFGLTAGDGLALETTICQEVRDHRRPVVINEVRSDPLFCNHPTPKLYGFQSYISMPIVLADGSFFGTLCAIDPKPNMLDRPETVAMFRLFAELIACNLDAQFKVSAAEASLKREEEIAALREQFVAVLGHDLRNPLAAVRAGVRLMRRNPARSAEVAALIEDSVARMSGMIDNVLDFARGRMGGGLDLRRHGGAPVGPALAHVVEELRSTHPERRIEARLQIDGPVPCDAGRIAQLLSNLLANALTHGDPVAPVRVEAKTAGDSFEVSVANAGTPIALPVRERLFQPFFRGAPDSTRGLGLGLYIAAEIARGHGGTLVVESDAAETRFTFRMPVGTGAAMAAG